jgi:hypothetical protein
MSFAIELNKRQSTRTLEQALRRQSEIMLEPRIAREGIPLVGTLLSGAEDSLEVEVTRDPEMLLDQLIGVYCEGHLQLGESRYLFSTYVIDVAPGQKHGRLVIQRPGAILVIQRRRFWRTRFAESSDISLHCESAAAQESMIGALCNVSPDGVAVRLTDRGAEELLIGDKVTTSFELPGLDYTFELDAVLCNKTPAGSPGTLILGLQFVGLDDMEDQLILLRNHLRNENRSGLRQEASE